MATYPTLAPTLLALSTTASDPQSTEDASKLVDAIRQTRQWSYDYLSKFFDDTTGALKPAAFSPQGGSLPAGYIRGSDPVTNAQREIAHNSVTGYDIADGAITNELIGPGTLTGDRIADGTITGAKYADGTIAPVKLSGNLAASMLAEGAIGTDNIADYAVTQSKIADESVGTDHIVDRAVDGTRLPEASVGMVLVGGQTIDGETDCFAPKTLSGAFTVDANGNVIVASGISGTYARITEIVPSGTGGGVPTPGGGGAVSPAAWMYRGVKSPWKQRFDKSDLVDISDEVIGLKKNGTYLVIARAPAYKVNGHRIKLEVYPDGNDATIVSGALGSCEYSSTAGAYAVTYSELVTLITVKNATSTNIPFMRLKHYLEDTTTPVINMMGKPVSITDVFETYAEISLFKIT